MYWEGFTQFEVIAGIVIVVTVVWNIMAIWALVECLIEHSQDKKELGRVRKEGLWLLITVAESRLRRARYMVKQAIMKVGIGAFAMYILTVIGVDPDVSGAQMLIRFFFVYDIYCFLQSKRSDRQLRPTLRQLGRKMKGSTERETKTEDES